MLICVFSVPLCLRVPVLQKGKTADLSISINIIANLFKRDFEFQFQ